MHFLHVKFLHGTPLYQTGGESELRYFGQVELDNHFDGTTSHRKDPIAPDSTNLER